MHLRRRYLEPPRVLHSARCFQAGMLMVEWRCCTCNRLFWRDATSQPKQCPHCDSSTRFELT